MKRRTFLACTMAALALAGCKKAATTGAPAGDDAITITMASPPPGGTWADVANATAAGFIMGNPKAKVRLVEIGALTCPHCRRFDEIGVPQLIDKYVKTGQVAWEFRSYLLNALDVPANLIARCNGPQSFFPLARALYKDQPVWIGKVQAAPQAQLEQVQNLQPGPQQYVEFAKLAGLQDWAAARGVAPAKSDQCLRDQRTVDQLVQNSSDITTQFPDFPGTPSFVIGGKMIDLSGKSEEQVWPAVEAKIKEALG